MTGPFRHAIHAGLLGAVGWGAAGCTTATSRYYFAAADLDERQQTTLTFYRVTVKGSSLNVKSTYQAGFYDATALHQLFGEVSSGQTSQSSSQTGPGFGTFQLVMDPGSGQWQVANDNERFTLIYGANADAIAQQVQLFADSDETGKQVGALLATAAGAKGVQDAEAARQDAVAARQKASDLSDRVSADAKKIDPDATTPDVAARKQLLDAVQASADAIGLKASYDATNLDVAFTQARADLAKAAKL